MLHKKNAAREPKANLQGFFLQQRQQENIRKVSEATTYKLESTKKLPPERKGYVFVTCRLDTTKQILTKVNQRTKIYNGQPLGAFG